MGKRTMQLPLGLPEEETRLRPEVAALPTRAERLARLLQGDLDFHGRQDASPLHALHPFPAKYPPQLPRLFIQHLTQPGEVVLDPMMGSGTTVLEARRGGRRAVGTDIDPLALHLVAAKVAPPSPLAFEEGFARVLRRAEAHLGAAGRLAEEYARRFDDATQRFLDHWFLPDTQRELLALSMPSSRRRRRYGFSCKSSFRVSSLPNRAAWSRPATFRTLGLTGCASPSNRRWRFFGSRPAGRCAC